MKKTVKLDDILSIARGASPRPISNYITNESAGVNWIKIGDVDPNSFFITHTEEKITKEGAKKSRYVKEGDFILSNSMSFGRPYILKINGCVHDGWLILSDYENHVTSSYLYYLLRSPIVQNQFDGSANGATVRNLNSDIVRKVSVSIHTDKSEQQKIAAHLDSIQSAIDNKKQQLQQLDELVKSKFVEMFHDKGFSKKKIGEIISISRGASPRPISAFVTNDLDGINWIKIGDVSEDSLYIEKTSERITKEGADKSRYVKPGDFILSNSMSFGRPYILKIYGCVHDGWLILSNYENTFNPLFLYYELRDDEVQSQFDGSANGATVRNLNSDIVKSIDVVVPPIELQNTFAEYVQKIDSAKAIIKTQLVDLQELLDSKMDEYFGE